MCSRVKNKHNLTSLPLATQRSSSIIMSKLFYLPFLCSLSIIVDASGSPDIHDILPDYNIPKGILPNAVKSYTLSQDGSFIIDMEHPCYVKFSDDQLVYYGKVIKGKLSYGKVSHVSGIQAKKLFIWVSVKGMDMDTDSNMVEFHVGALSQKLPAQQFETIPSCINKASFTSGTSDYYALKLKSWLNY